jgi:hypothetical protein
MNWQDNFSDAFQKCLEDGVYPGPTAINRHLTDMGVQRGSVRRLNREESALRVKLMELHRVPYRGGSQRGQIPNSGTRRVILG